ncbi:MAG: DUF2834 domain-containing protein [Cyanobacteriota bacterium]|jgi:Terpene cyclase DEP1|nr:DUF2834 domain-containing protein [Cyanobacteriota bacterium]
MSTNTSQGQPAPNPEQPTGTPSGRAWLAWIYLALAVAGAVLPWLANIDFIQAYGASGDIGLFVQLANANPAAASLSRDLGIGATAVTIWMVSEGRRLSMRGVPWVLLSCVTVAFAFGAPLFLHLRERRLQELARLV